MTQEQLKSKYGWSKELEEIIINTNPTLSSEWRGSFKIKKHKDRYFWYYKLSKRGKGRDKYLCSVDIKNVTNSFTACCKILHEKVNNGFLI